MKTQDGVKYDELVRGLVVIVDYRDRKRTGVIDVVEFDPMTYGSAAIWVKVRMSSVSLVSKHVPLGGIVQVFKPGSRVAGDYVLSIEPRPGDEHPALRNRHESADWDTDVVFTHAEHGVVSRAPITPARSFVIKAARDFMLPLTSTEVVSFIDRAENAAHYREIYQSWPASIQARIDNLLKGDA